MTIDVAIDLSQNHGPARNQGNRPTCLAFALSDMNGVHNGFQGFLSPDYVYANAAILMPGWRPGDGLTLDSSLAAVQSPGQPEEQHWAYSNDEPATPLIAPPLYDPMYAASFKKSMPDLNEIVSCVDRGEPVGLIMNLTREFFSPEDITGIIPFTDGALPSSSHAVLVVGYGIHMVTRELHFFIRNSWGDGWGVQGHAWVSSEYINAHATNTFGA